MSDSASQVSFIAKVEMQTRFWKKETYEDDNFKLHVST
jgi:hypothetical protein